GHHHLLPRLLPVGRGAARGPRPQVPAMTTAGAYQPSPAEAGEPEAGTLLSGRDLRVVFQRRGRRPVHAVDGISLEVEAGRTIGVVGESGCGKRGTAVAILGGLP